MTALDDIQFLRPAWLAGLLALPLAVAWCRRWQRRGEGWRRHVDAHLLPHLLDTDSTRNGRAGLAAVLAAIALAVVALAGPSWRSAPLPVQRGGTPLVVALQLAGSTRAADLPPSRLLQARARIGRILASRAGAPVGLVVYAQDAFVVAPLTDDAANVALFLDSLAPDIMPVDGDRPARAIDVAVRLLQQAGVDSGEILLVADGASGGEALAAATRAMARGYRVSALGMGRETGATYRAADGTLAQARLDAGSLQALAAAGGGTYRGWDGGLPSSSAPGPLASPAAGGAASGSAPVALDGGYWLLPPLLALVLLAFRRGAAVAVLVLGLSLPWHPAAARQPVEGTPWRRADQVTHALDRDAETAYRRGDFAAAARAWARPGGADADYNRGNALAREGRYEDAIAAYDAALRARPGMPDALANRAAVRAAMQRKPPPGPKKGSGGKPDAPGTPPPPTDASNQNSAGKDGSPQAGGRPPPEAPASGQPPSSPPPPSTDGSGTPGSATPRLTPAQQRQADAAQRRDMEQALRRTDGGAGGGAPSTPRRRVETTAERERRQANEAWLQRVPDDPGGLLRAKFRLEHERRQRGWTGQ